MKRIGIISALLVVMLLVSTSCASGIPQEAYDRVQDELSTIESELATLQGKLAESEALQAQNEELSTILDTIRGEYEAAQAEYDELSAELDELRDNFNDIQSDYEAIQAQYEELSADYDALVKEGEVVEEEEEVVEEIIEEDVEQAVFKLVNQERTSNGLDELTWGANLYKYARNNSANMEASKVLENSDYPSNWQEVYWTTGYNNTDEIVEAIWMIWENKQLYSNHFLNPGAKYAAIGIHKSGAIFYITYIADAFP